MSAAMYNLTSYSVSLSVMRLITSSFVGGANAFAFYDGPSSISFNLSSKVSSHHPTSYHKGKKVGVLLLQEKEPLFLRRDHSSIIVMYASCIDEQSTRRRDMLQRIMFSTSACFNSPLIASAANMPTNTGADLSKTGSIDTLIPIVAIKNTLQSTKSTINNAAVSSSPVSPETCKNLLQSLSAIPRDEITFKRLFDSYSTQVSYKQKFLDQNAFLVYYSKGFDGTGRPNIEEDTNTIQTLQYGSRNDAWAAMDDLFVELEFGKKAKANDSSLSTNEELIALIEKVSNAVDSYLSLAPVEDVTDAKRSLGK